MIQAMPNISSAGELRTSIQILEERQMIEAHILKERFNAAYNSVKPINLIKSIFAEAAESDEIKRKIVNTSVGLTAGLISKIVFQGVTKNPVKKLIGTALMFGITNLVAKNPESIKVFTQGVLNIFKRRKTKIPESAT